MDDVHIVYKDRPTLRDPIFIEGLPGVGNVGKLAAEHLIDELEAVKFADIFSRFFPPQVLVNDEGIVKLVNNELYYYRNPNGGSGEGDGDGDTKASGSSRDGEGEVKGNGKDKGNDKDKEKDKEKKELPPPLGAGRDFIFLVGDYQGLSPEGQYSLAGAMLDVAQEMGVKTIFTLGGYGLGKMITHPNVLGAATGKELIAYMKKVGVLFKEGEPGSGIVGASGLLLGEGKLRGMEGVCLMGETSGYFVDPKSAQAVLEILAATLGVRVDYTKLEEKASQIEKLEKHLKDMEVAAGSGPDPSSDDLHYIG